MFMGRWTDFVDLTHAGYLAAFASIPLIVALERHSLSGLGPVRRSLAIGLRCLVIAAMSLALASREWVRTTDDQTVGFAADQSNRVPLTSRHTAARFIWTATAGMRLGKDRVAVFGFDVRGRQRPAVAADLRARDHLASHSELFEQPFTPRLRNGD
jgi:hypothetical protein